tara:strand:- start:5157 stop:5957 length:801 start_codon:yes stop_codon:yes gene_type:complete
MIKFFRHIRKSMIMKNNTLKYFKYAIGEIALVMIGILLALQVNNWNEEKKLQRLKVVYIDKMIEDLKSDIVNNTLNKAEVENLANYGKYVIEVVTKNKSVKDKSEFVLKLQQTGRVNFPNLANNTYIDLESSGNLKLFKNEELIDAIRSYYKSDSDFWREAYISRTAEGLLPKVVEILPFDLQEQIMNSEIERAKTKKTYDIENRVDLKISDKAFLAIITKLKTRDDLKFHLKNATRAHMLQIRFDIESTEKAKNIIELLEKTKND